VRAQQARAAKGGDMSASTSASIVKPEECRLWIKTVQAGAMRTLFEVLKEIVFDCNIIFDEHGARLVCMDGSRCALIYLRLRADSFEEYRCEGKVRCGINMSSMHKLMRTCGTHDSIAMYNTRAETNALGIRITNTDKQSTTQFSLKLLDVDGQDLNVPEVEFDNVVTLPSAYLQRIVRDMTNLADTMTIKCHGNTLTLSCDGDFASQETVIGDAEAASPSPSPSQPGTDGANDGIAAASKTQEPIVGTYSLKYLSLFCRASSLSNVIELFFKQAYPLILKYNVAGLGELRFVIAPQVDG